MKGFIKNRKFHIFFFQCLGSFILTYGACSAGLHETPDLIVAASLFLAVSLTGEVTGGYINPLITIGTFIQKRHKKIKLYLISQLVGAFLGTLFSWALLGKIDAPYQQNWDPQDTTKFIINQFVGSSIFTMCVLTLTNKLTSHATKSWQIYLSIPVALFLTRKLTGDTVLNPVVGLSLQLVAAIIKSDSLIFFRDVWLLVLPSILGSIIGGFFILKFYQPLLLYIKFKDLQGEQEEYVPNDEKQVEEQRQQ